MCEKKIKKSIFVLFLIPLSLSGLISVTASIAKVHAQNVPTANCNVTGTETYKVLKANPDTLDDVSFVRRDTGKTAAGTACTANARTFTYSGEANTWSTTGNAAGTCGSQLIVQGAALGTAASPGTLIEREMKNGTCTVTKTVNTQIAYNKDQAEAGNNGDIYGGDDANGDGVTDGTAGDEETTAAPTSCAIDGVGWLVCNVANFIAGTVDGLYGYVSDTFISIDSGLLSNKSETRKAWSSLLGIANIIFVIIFMVIIFSQATGYGISNYGIKKMLPNIIVGVILINASYYICQAAVDLSNLLGYGFTDIFKAVAPPSGTVATSWTTIITTVLALGVAAGGIAIAAQGFGLSFVLLCLLTIVFIAIVLVIQKVLVVVCVVFSPIAFAARLLPNTKKLFDSWWKIFYAMLLIFPLTSLVLGASSFASEVLVKSMTSSSIEAQQKADAADKEG